MGRHVYIAIPACDEETYLPKTLATLNEQSINHFSVWICVNQPEKWNFDSQKVRVIESNARLLQFLEKNKDNYKFPLYVFDCSSPGKGWASDKWGASIARKYLMDSISLQARDDDIIASLDADTWVEPQYVEAIQDAFERFPRIAGITIPYIHWLEGDEQLQRTTIRYETYLRNYFLGLLSIGSPYSYVPIGSAFAVTAKAYKAVRGMPLRTAGEDFYFLQKVRQTGFILPFAETIVHPAGRVSERVLFGTGKALSYSFIDMCRKYPIFTEKGFTMIGRIYQEFSEIASTRMWNHEMECIKHIDKQELNKILANYRFSHHIEHALHIQFNALKIFKSLRENQPYEYDEKTALSEFLRKWSLESFETILWDGPLADLKAFQKKLFNLELKQVKYKLDHLKRKNKKWWKYLACW